MKPLMILLAMSAYDAVGFGLFLTRQAWGDATQIRPFTSSTAAARYAYHGSLWILWAAALLWAQSAALVIWVAFGFQDLLYHIWLGHFLPGSNWRPFANWEYSKPTVVHHWLIRAVSDRTMTRKEDTTCRLIGGAVGLVVWVLIQTNMI